MARASEQAAGSTIRRRRVVRRGCSSCSPACSRSSRAVAPASALEPQPLDTGTVIRYGSLLTANTSLVQPFLAGRFVSTAAGPDLQQTTTAGDATLGSGATAIASGNFDGSGREASVAASTCNGRVCLRIQTAAGWTRPIDTGLVQNLATFAPNRTVLAAGNLDGDAGGTDELAIAWTSAEPPAVDHLQLRIVALRLTLGATPSVQLLSNNVFLSVPVTTCGAGVWTGSRARRRRTPSWSARTACRSP